MALSHVYPPIVVRYRRSGFSGGKDSLWVNYHPFALAVLTVRIQDEANNEHYAANCPRGLIFFAISDSSPNPLQHFLKLYYLSLGVLFKLYCVL